MRNSDLSVKPLKSEQVKSMMTDIAKAQTEDSRATTLF